MLIYSGEFFTADNGNGYSLSERDAICGNCHKVVDRQKKYLGEKAFKFSSEKKDWKFCPYCRQPFVENDER